MDCYSFPVGLFHPLQHSGLSRRSTPFAHTLEFEQFSGEVFNFDGSDDGSMYQLAPTHVLEGAAERRF